MKKISVFPLLGHVHSDCSNNGIVVRNANKNQFGGIMKLLDGTPEEISAYAETIDDLEKEKTLVLVRRYLWGEPHYYAEPLVKGKGYQMFGGNYISTSDGRFKEFTAYELGLPIPVHDRYETQKEYDALSK